MSHPLPQTVAVAGAGTMGVGIAVSFAAAGCDVRLTARRASSLDAARRRAGAIGENEAALERIVFTTSAEDALAGADLVVESIVEEVDPKRELLRLAEQVSADGAILSTNTSSLPLASLETALEQPERFAGLHWLNPPELVELVEVVGGEHTDTAVLEALAAWMEQIGKAPIVVRRDVPGFVANRLQYALLREAWALIESGVCSYADIDRVLTRGLGARWAAIGPIQIMDLGGLDVFRAVSGNLLPDLDCASEPPDWLADAVESGDLGCKSGRGLLGDYAPEDVARLGARRERVLRGLPALRSDTALDLEA